MRRDDGREPASLGGVQPGSSPGTSLLYPRLAQAWGELSQTPHRVGLWPAPGEKSQRENLAQGACVGVSEKQPPLYHLDPTLRVSGEGPSR